METPGRRRPQKRLPAFSLAGVAVGIVLVGAGAGWAARGLVHSDPAPAVAAAPKRASPAKAAPASVAPPAAPRPPATLHVDGILVEDTPLVRRFLGRSLRCGRVAGSDVYASVFDFLKLRTRGVASPPFHYEVRQTHRDGYDYVVIREEIVQRDGSPFPGAPGYVVHTYYFDAPMSRFELASSAPEDPDFSPAMLREMGNPLGFMVLNLQAVCNGAFYLHRAQATSAAPSGNAASTATSETAAHAPAPGSGLGQWGGSAE